MLSIINLKRQKIQLLTTLFHILSQKTTKDHNSTTPSHFIIKMVNIHHCTNNINLELHRFTSLCINNKLESDPALCLQVS